MNIENTTTQVCVENYLNFFNQSDRNPSTLKEVLDEKFHFQSPLGEFFTAESFLQDLKRNVLDIRNVKIRQIMVDQNNACALYDVHSNDPEIGTLSFSEWFEVKNGKISSIKSTYDATEVRKTLSQI